MAFINKYNIKNSQPFKILIALLPFSSDEDKCQMLRLTQIHDLNNYNWYIVNTSSIKDLGLGDKETVGFIYKDGNESSLKEFIQSSNNYDLQFICINIKELNNI